MPNPWQYALMVGPLGFYFWAVAVRNGGRRPVVVSGLVDHVLLCFGIGGVLAFGPFGRLVARSLFGTPDTIDWLALLSGFGLFACFLARRALRRLVVYNVEAATLTLAMTDVLSTVDGEFVRTLSGFEDRRSGRGLAVDVSKRLRSATVEAYGKDSEPLIQAVRPKLRARLKEAEPSATRLAAVFYGVSLAVMVGPLVGLFVSQPAAREGLRALIDRIRGV